MLITTQHYAFQQKHPNKINFRPSTDGNGMAICYTPGDGYRYVIYVSDVPGKEFGGASIDQKLVSVMLGSNQFVSAFLDAYSYPQYIMDKMKLPHATAHHVYDVLGFVFGRKGEVLSHG